MTDIPTFYDAPSIAARCTMEDRLRVASREAIIAEAGRDRHHRRAYIADAGHLLVRLGARLQAIATRPATMEETVQW